MYTSTDPNEAVSLQRHLERLHGRAEHVGTVHTSETFRGQTAWEVAVHLFDVDRDGAPERLFAFLQPVRGPEHARLFLIPRSDAVPDPHHAVREAISRQVGASAKREGNAS